MFSPLEQFDVVPVIFLCINNYDYSLPNIILPLIIILLTSFWIKNILKKALFIPTIFQYLIEILTEFIFSILKQQLGKEGYLFFPLIFTLFNFILISNYISLLPMGIALTSHIIITLYISISLCSSIFLFGLIKNKLHFLKLFVPTCPLILMPMLILIELFSYGLRSFSLAIRLSANILAGHTLVYIISLSIFSLISIKFIYFFFGFILLFPVLVLEFCIAFLQAYVYCTLVCLYIRETYEGH